jgi:hypothetical protein
MCLFLSVLEMLIGMLIFVCQWVMKVVLLLSSNVWALFYMWGFFSLVLCLGLTVGGQELNPKLQPLKMLTR